MSSAAVGALRTPTPGYTLFDANAVTLATLFGSPIAGTSLMAVNYRRLGQARKAVMALAIGLSITGFLILLGWNLPSSVASPIALICLFAIQRSARSLQGAAVKEHVEEGGSLGSKWKAFGLGIAFFAILFLAVFIPAYIADNGHKVVIGSKDEVFYSGSATREEAQSLGSALKASEYFSDRGVSVLLNKGKDGTILSFIAKEGSWNQPDLVSMFEEMGREVAPSVGGLPIQVRLMNKERDVKTESTVGKEVFSGDDVVYYLGAATESEAQALGQALKSNEFFSGKAADVFLSKHEDGTVLSFVVGNGVWDQPAVVGEFEKIVRQSASAAGGLPIRLRLVSTKLEVKKDELIH